MGWGTLDREAYLTLVPGLVELAPDANLRLVAILRAAEFGGVGVMRMSGTVLDGSDFEIVFIGVSVFRGDNASALEMYSCDDLDVALARFEELGARYAAASQS